MLPGVAEVFRGGGNEPVPDNSSAFTTLLISKYCESYVLLFNYSYVRNIYIIYKVVN